MIIKYHRGAQALASLNTKAIQTWYNSGTWYGNMLYVTTISYKNINGTEYSRIMSGWNTSFSNSPNTYIEMRNLYRNLTAKCSTETIDQFDEHSYSVSGGDIVGTVTQTYTNGLANGLYSLNVTNNTENDITINSVKFTKPIWNEAVETPVPTLVYTVYLDSPVIIPPTKTKQIVVNFSFDNS